MIRRSSAPLRSALLRSALLRPARRPMERTWRIVLLGASAPVLLGASPATATRLAPPGITASIGRPAPVAASDTVLVAARELPRGTVLRATDMDTVVVASGSPSGSRQSATTSGAGLPDEGWVVRRLVHKGEPLRAPAVAPPPLILAGSPVSLLWEVGGLRITRAGTAVGPAHAGETVVVRVDAKRRFIGVATAPGTVTVVPP
ncbi:MAG: flagellar basal body P-ring formation chaperone FlgA [Gemmatimonadaceae bacterium]